MTDSFALDRFSGVIIVESPDMVGAKTAIRRGDTCYVSPAMADLLKHTTTRRERQKLLDSIPVIYQKIE